MGFTTTQALAGAMTLQATGTEKASYSSNPLLVVSGEQSLWGSTTEPELFFKDATPTSSLTSDTRIDQNIFNQSAFNSTDGHENIAFMTSNARWKLSVKGQGDYDTTRTSEITNFGLAPVVVRHTGLSVAPEISYSPSSADTISLAGTTSASTYHDRIFTDYEIFSATPTYSHALDPLNKVFVSVEAQRYQTTNNTNTEIDSVGPEIGWKATLGPRLTANAAIGAQTTREFQSGAPVSPWTWQYTFSAGMNFTGIQDIIALTATRQQQPYGNGTQALQTYFSASESHALNALFSLNGGGSYQTSSYPSAVQGNIKSLTTATAGATYHATERLDLTASYQYRYETLVNNAAATAKNSAQDHAMILALSYHPQLWSLNR